VIIRTVLRLCAVQALMDLTLAQQRVYDSTNKPLLDVLMLDNKSYPFISVYTDNDNLVRNTIEHGIYSATHETQLVLEIGMASAVLAQGKTKTIQVPHTDDAMEMTLDFMQAQALASIIGDPRSEWAEIIRDMKINILALASQRSGRADKGGNWAARQVVITLDTISDPVPGAVLDDEHPVKRFIALAKSLAPEGTLAGAMLLETYMSMYPFGDVQASWEKVQSMLGLTRRGLRGIGLAPLTATPEGASPWATEVGLPIVGPDNEPPLTSRIFGQNTSYQPDTTPEGEGEPELDVVPYDPNGPNAP
jgi:hypothetical protein